MNRTKLCETLIFAVLFIAIGCSRRDYISSGILKDGSVDVKWLKSEFFRAKAAGLLNVKLGARSFYNTTPQWENASTRKDTTGKVFYYVPLKDDTYATIDGKKRRLKLLNQRTYLVAFAANGNSGEDLTFVKGEYIMETVPTTNPNGRSVANAPLNREVFSGLAAYTDQLNRVAAYRYKLSSEKSINPVRLYSRQYNGNTGTMSLAEIPAIEGPLQDSMLLADELLAYWNIPLTVLQLLESGTGIGLVFFPDEYRKYIPPSELYRFSELLSLFRIALVLGPDDENLPVEGLLVCSRICRWAFGNNAPTTSTELEEVGIATRIQDGDACTRPPSGPQGWTLLSSEPGPCRWSYPNGQGPVTGPGGPPTPGDLTGGSGSGGGTNGGDETDSPPTVFIREVPPGPFATPLAFNEWGRTELEGLDLYIGAYTDGSVWSGRLFSIEQKYSMRVRLLDSVQEVTETNSTAQNFCKQVVNLQLGTRQILEWPHWFKLGAVQVHENVHRSRLIPILNEILPEVITKVGLLQVPDNGQTKEVAISQLKALPGFGIALINATQTTALKYEQRGGEDHAFGAACDQAEYSILDPAWKQVCAKAQQEVWAACSYCR